MSRLGRSMAAAALGWGGVLIVAPPASADTGSATGGAITIPAGAPVTTQGPASPYPSTVSLSGVGGTLVEVEVGLNGFAHTFLDNLLIVLEAPSGDTVALVSGCGGADDALGVDIVFADGGFAWADGTSGGNLSANTYSPTTCEAVALDAPGPAGPYGTTLSSLAGDGPNGEWRLWVFDRTGGDVGGLTSWTLDVVTTNSAPVAADGAFSTPFETPLDDTLAPLASDVDDDAPLTFALGTPPASGDVVLEANGDFVYTPDPGFSGVDSFTYTVDDGVETSGESEPATVTITVQPAQVPTTTTTSTTSTTAPTTSTTAPTTSTTARAVLARTGVDRGTAARGGAASLLVGVVLVGTSTFLVNRSRRWKHVAR